MITITVTGVQGEDKTTIARLIFDRLNDPRLFNELPQTIKVRMEDGEDEPSFGYANPTILIKTETLR